MSTYNEADFKISAECTTLANNLDDNFTSVDEDVIVFEENTFEKTLPANITMEDVEKIQAHIKAFAASATMSFGRQAVHTMAENEAYDTVRSNAILIGEDKLELAIERSRDGIKPGTNEPITSYGLIKPIYTTQARRKTGQMGKVTKAIKAMGSEMLRG